MARNSITCLLASHIGLVQFVAEIPSAINSMARLCLTAFSFVSCWVGVVVAQDGLTITGNIAAEQKALDQLTVVSAFRGSSDFPQRYSQVLAAATHGQLLQYKTIENASIAVQAEWAILKRSASSNGRLHAEPIRDRQTLSRFVGFLEGRAKLEIPKWWSDYVIEGINAHPTWYHNAGLEFVLAPSDTAVAFDSNSLILTKSGDSIQLPERLFEQRLDSQLFCRLSACFTDEHCVVAVHSDSGGAHKVAAIDRKTRRLLWENRACGCTSGRTTNESESWVTICHQDPNVVVFGAAATGFYVHAFSAETGEERFKFSTRFDP